MKVEIKEGEGLQRDITVEIPVDTVKAEMDKMFSDHRKNAQLKGFRKGHAPMNMIESIYGEQVQADVVDKLIKESFPSAVAENSLNVATPPTVTDVDFKEDGALKYTARVEVLPEVGKVDYEGLEIPVADTEANDEEIEAAVEQFRYQLSELRKLSREAKDGDVLVADLHKLADSKNVMKQTEFLDSQIDLGNKMTVKEFKAELVGVKEGDVKEVTVVYAEDYSDPTFAGAEITYRCEIKSVNERLLPDFDDALVKRSGVAETALELKLKIREDLKQRNENTQRRVHKQEITRQICSKNEVPVPVGLVNDYVDRMVEEAKKQNSDVNEEDIRKQYRSIGEEGLRWDLLWHTLAGQESIEVLPSDTEKWINSLATQNGITPDAAKTALNQSGRINQLRDSILEEKTLDFLIEKAGKVPLKMQDADSKSK